MYKPWKSEVTVPRYISVLNKSKRWLSRSEDKRVKSRDILVIRLADTAEELYHKLGSSF